MEERWMGEGGEKAEGEMTDKNAREREGEDTTHDQTQARD